MIFQSGLCKKAFSHTMCNANNSEPKEQKQQTFDNRQREKGRKKPVDKQK